MGRIRWVGSSSRVDMKVPSATGRKPTPAHTTSPIVGSGRGKGIWGVWEIVPYGSGGFHIWPIGSGVGREEVEESTEQRIPEELLVFERPGGGGSILRDCSISSDGAFFDEIEQDAGG